MTDIPRAHDDPIIVEPEQAETQVPDVRILGANDVLNTEVKLPMELVDVPEWGGSVFVRMLGGTEKDAWEASCRTVVPKKDGTYELKPNLVNMRARLCVRCMCDADGNRLFADEQATILGKKSAKALDRIFEVAQRLSGSTNEDIEKLEKNSEGTDSDGSSLS